MHILPENKSKSIIGRLAIFMFVLGLSLSHQTTVHADNKQKPDTILIFDASRSMWGQIDGVHRYQLAHGVISNQLRARPKERNLGLVAFGHRTSSNCGDIETIVAPRQFDTEGYIAALGTIKPKGKTPISTSIESATNEFATTAKTKNIILLTDGLDNCKTDPCETATRLKRQNPTLRIHTIAFAVEEELHNKLQCVSRETGGKFFHANTEIELSIAFKDALAATEDSSKKVVTAAKTPAKNTSKSDITPTASMRIPDPRAGWDHIAMNGVDPSLRMVRAKSADGRSGLKLSARMAENTPVITNNIKWTIFKYDLVRQKIGEKIATKTASTPALKLPSGEYVVRLTYDHITASNVIAFNEGEVANATFILNAGGLTINTQLANLNTPRGKSAKQWLYGRLKNKDGKPQAYAKITKPNSTIRLNAGTYTLVSQFGGANSLVETEVTIKPGFLTEVAINHKAGVIAFKFSEGSSNPLAWKIYDSENKLINTANKRSNTFVLAPGEYLAETTYNGKTYRARFSVEVGKSKTIPVSGT